jgi:hypothetical protein
MKILASFDGEADQMIPKVSWYHRDRKERIAICAIQAFEVALSGWLLCSLRAMDTTLLTDTLIKMVGPPALQFRERIQEWWDASTVRSVFDYNQNNKREAVERLNTEARPESVGMWQLFSKLS